MDYQTFSMGLGLASDASMLSSFFPFLIRRLSCRTKTGCESCLIPLLNFMFKPQSAITASTDANFQRLDPTRRDCMCESSNRLQSTTTALPEPNRLMPLVYWGLLLHERQIRHHITCCHEYAVFRCVRTRTLKATK